MSDTKKIRIKDYTGEHLYHPETEADIVLRGNSNVAADLTQIEYDLAHIPVYSLTKAAQADDGYAATYHLTKDGVNEGATINIPKDFVVKKVEVKVCTQADVPIQGLHVGDKYIDFTINVDPGESDESGAETEQHIYLAVSDFFVPYTGGTGINIDGTEISVKIDNKTLTANGQGVISAASSMYYEVVE